MAKLTKDEFISKYNEKLAGNDDLIIELMEDISDSISDKESAELDGIKKELEDLKMKYEDLKAKYKERFLTAVKFEEDPENKEEEELKEEEVIDVKEI